MSNEATQDVAAIVKLYAALAKAQGEFLPITKNRTVKITPREKAAYEFRYADLEEVFSKTRPALSKHGLALIQTIKETDRGLTLVCHLVHEQGGSITSELPIMNPNGDPKQFGAMVSYLRRYLATAILGVAADDDLDEDGNSADGHGAMPAPTERKAPPQTQQQSAAPATKTAEKGPATLEEPAFVKRLPSWHKQIEDGMKPADLLATIATRYALTEEQKTRITESATSSAG